MKSHLKYNIFLMALFTSTASYGLSGSPIEASAVRAGGIVVMADKSDDAAASAPASTLGSVSPLEVSAVGTEAGIVTTGAGAAAVGAVGDLASASALGSDPKSTPTLFNSLSNPALLGGVAPAGIVIITGDDDHDEGDVLPDGTQVTTDIPVDPGQGAGSTVVCYTN